MNQKKKWNIYISKREIWRNRENEPNSS